MNYLFYVHSNLTYTMALSIVDIRKLEKEQCIFICFRNFVPEADGTIPIILNLRSFYKSKFLGLLTQLKFKHLSKTGFVYHSILNNEKFELFIPNHKLDFFTELIHFKNCVAYSYLEEGLMSYQHDSSSHYFNFKHQKFLRAYGLDKSTFPTLEPTQKTVVKWPFKNKVELGNIENLFAPDMSPDMEYCSHESYAIGIRFMLDNLIDNGQKVLHVKFHPGQRKSKVDALAIFEEYKPKIDVNILEPEVKVEDIISSTLDATFYIMISSIGLYANFKNKTVLSIGKKIAEIDKNYEPYLSSVSQVWPIQYL